MNKKAFLLLDSLVIISIIINLTLLIASFYQLLNKHNEQNNYHEINLNNKLETILNNTYSCEGCLIDVEY